MRVLRVVALVAGYAAVMGGIAFLSFSQEPWRWTGTLALLLVVIGAAWVAERIHQLEVGVGFLRIQNDDLRAYIRRHPELFSDFADFMKSRQQMRLDGEL